MSADQQYLGNPNLKKANVAQSFTPDQIEEFIKCSKDPVYFIQKYIKIVSLDKGLIPFEMYDFQVDMTRKFHDNRFNIAKLPRQSGKSTIVTSYLLWYVLFNDNVNVAILANKAATAREMLQRLQLSYENLPKWLQQGISQWNRGSLELENGSKIMAASTSASAVRGMSFNVIFLDEFAFIPNHIADHRHHNSILRRGCCDPPMQSQTPRRPAMLPTNSTACSRYRCSPGTLHPP